MGSSHIDSSTAVSLVMQIKVQLGKVSCKNLAVGSWKLHESVVKLETSENHGLVVWENAQLLADLKVGNALPLDTFVF